MSAALEPPEIRLANVTKQFRERTAVDDVTEPHMPPLTWPYCSWTSTCSKADQPCPPTLA